MDSYSKASRLSWFNELYMTGDGILTHTTLHPYLSQLITRLIDRHAGFKVVHAAQDKVHRLISIGKVTFAAIR